MILRRGVRAGVADLLRAGEACAGVGDFLRMLFVLDEDAVGDEDEDEDGVWAREGNWPWRGELLGFVARVCRSLPETARRGGREGADAGAALAFLPLAVVFLTREAAGARV